MLSMTGFGAIKCKLNNGELTTQVKSVNSRFLDVKIHIPREYNLFEKDVRSLLKKHMFRGNVELYCSKKTDSQKNKFRVATDLEMAKKWMLAYKQMSKDLKLSNDNVSLQDIIKSVPVLSLKEDKTVSASEKKIFLKNVNDAILLCLKERKREGLALKSALKKLLDLLQKEVKVIEKNRNLANKEIEKKWKTKLERFKNDQKIDSKRLAQEASVLIEKSDINEEIVRLAEHISSCKKLLLAKGRIGKKLDFYSQELLREVNTIGSKSQVVALTQSVVNCKSFIEQIREQVQNVE